MPFEKFTGKGSGGGQRHTEPYISLRKSGSIGVNHAATEEFFDDADWAVLYYDKFNQLIGIVPKREKDESAYKVRKSNKKGHGAQINCKAFTREYGLRGDKTRRYSPEWNDEEEMVIIDVGNPIQEVSS